MTYIAMPSWRALSTNESTGQNTSSAAYAAVIRALHNAATFGPRFECLYKQPNWQNTSPPLGA